jgi:hypothetical protein
MRFLRLADAPPGLGYAWARLAQRVFFSIFLCLCLRIFLRRFLITEPNATPRRA